ncbi:unnamed protein product [Amoebophrya sp. A25]|nr:unnamed protein product [Amoebophrya sp. A25]|eukprot:GSA25T00018726001.1
MTIGRTRRRMTRKSLQKMKRRGPLVQGYAMGTRSMKRGIKQIKATPKREKRMTIKRRTRFQSYQMAERSSILGVSYEQEHLLTYT